MQLLVKLHFTVMEQITTERLCIFIMTCIISEKNHSLTGPLTLLHVCWRWEKQIQHHLNQGNVCQCRVYMPGDNHLRKYKQKWPSLRLNNNWELLETSIGHKKTNNLIFFSLTNWCQFFIHLSWTLLIMNFVLTLSQLLWIHRVIANTNVLVRKHRKNWHQFIFLE